MIWEFGEPTTAPAPHARPAALTPAPHSVCRSSGRGDSFPQNGPRQPTSCNRASTITDSHLLGNGSPSAATRVPSQTATCLGMGRPLRPPSAPTRQASHRVCRSPGRGDSFPQNGPRQQARCDRAVPSQTAPCLGMGRPLRPPRTPTQPASHRVCRSPGRGDSFPQNGPRQQARCDRAVPSRTGTVLGNGSPSAPARVPSQTATCLGMGHPYNGTCPSCTDHALA